MASQSRSSTAIRWSNHSVTSWPSSRSGVAVRPSSSCGLEVVEQPVVRRRRGVVELVDDDDVERVGRDLLQPICVQRLDHREDVPALRDPAAAVDLAERAVAKHGAIGRQRLPQDLLAVRDEQQRQVACRSRQLPVVERGDDGLARTCRRDDEVAMTVMALPLDRQRLEHPLLVRVRPDIEVRERDRRGLAERAPVVLAQRLAPARRR